MKTYAAIITILFPLTILACPKVNFSCGGSYPVHLSFDDGPHPNTERLLWILKQEKVRASFFPLAKKLVDTKGRRRSNSTANFKILDKMKKDGHTIGTHTYEHIHHFDHMKGKERVNEGQLIDSHGIDWRDNIDIPRSSGALKPYIQKGGKLYYRLPYGQGWYEAERRSKRDTEVLEHLLDPRGSDATPLHVGWDIDSSDWRYQKMKLSPKEDKKFLQDVAKQICNKKGGMVLMHDHTEIVSRNLSCLIKGIKKAGHNFTSIDGLKSKRVGANGPKIVMSHRDLAGVSHRDCDNSADRDELQKNQNLLDQLIDKLRKNDEYTPPQLQIVRGNIYEARDKAGKLKYQPVASFTKFKTVEKLVESTEFKDFLQKNSLTTDSIIFFLGDDHKIQIGKK